MRKFFRLKEDGPKSGTVWERLDRGYRLVCHDGAPVTVSARAFWSFEPDELDELDDGESAAVEVLLS